MRPPPPCTIRRAARWPHRNGPSKVNAMTFWNVSASVSRNGVLCPAAALATNASMPPSSSASWSITASAPRHAGEGGLAVRDPDAVPLQLGHDLGEVGLVLVPGEPDVESVAG